MMLCFPLKERQKAELALLLPLSRLLWREKCTFSADARDVSVFPVFQFCLLLVICFDDLTMISTFRWFVRADETSFYAFWPLSFWIYTKTGPYPLQQHSSVTFWHYTDFSFLLNADLGRRFQSVSHDECCLHVLRVKLSSRLQLCRGPYC